MKTILNAFQYTGKFVSCQPYGSGHINDTFLVVTAQKSQLNRYILQKVRRSIFKTPTGLMDNIQKVTTYTKQTILKYGGQPDRESLTLVLTHHGLPYTLDQEGELWRSYLFIDHSICHEKTDDPAVFYEAARGFGQFQLYLEGFDSQSLIETIPDFHHTPNRYRQLKEAMRVNFDHRADQTEQEIAFALERACSASILVDALANQTLPLRVTHNDTKLSNVLFDEKTGQSLCVIDLDTVMPGTALFDYGDAIRYGASAAAEDEKDLSLVYFNLELAEAFTRGYMETAGTLLTDAEVAHMTWAVKIITLENGIRFLADYLLGDTYYKTSYAGQNLDRCRTQFKLVADLENNWQTYQSMVYRISNRPWLL